MTRIFLSHNSRDQEWCEWLKASAEEMGIAAYLAEHDVRPGTNLAAKVTAAIDASDAVVVLITDNSVQAPYVQQEIGWALKGGKVVIPLLQPDIATDRLGMLQGLEYIPFDFDAPHEGHQRLRKALHQLVQQQTEPQQRDTTPALVALAVLALLFLALDSR